MMKSIAIVCLLASGGSCFATPVPVLSVVEYLASITPDHVFETDVDITGITDLYGYQLDLSFNPAALQVVSVSEGGFLQKDGGTTFFSGGSIDNTAGSISSTLDTLVTAGAGVSGTGRL